jgi:hypothetical protein
MSLLVATGKLLLGVASAGFGASLGFALKGWLEARDRVRD